MLKKLTNLEEVIELVKDDPVRPNIDPQWRITPPREVYTIDGIAGLCVAFTNSIPISEMDLVGRLHTGNIAVFYTVWSKEKGAGRKILLDLQQKYKDNNNVKRFITLSPKTEMAMKFHLSNGAIEVKVNETSQNFEYKM